MEVAAQNRKVVLDAYKEVRRAIRVAFAGDDRMIRTARFFCYNSFRSDPIRGVKPDTTRYVHYKPKMRPAEFDGSRPTKFEEKRPMKFEGSEMSETAIEHALSVAKLLRENVVQGTASGSSPNRFSM